MVKYAQAVPATWDRPRGRSNTVEPVVPEVNPAAEEQASPPFDQAVLDRLVAEVHRSTMRRAPNTTGFITRIWLDEARRIWEEEARLAAKSAPDVSDRDRPLVESALLHSWRLTEKKLRPKAWVEKFYQAKTEDDRRGIFFRALKSRCLDKLRQRRREARRFVSLDGLAEDSGGTGGGASALGEAMPSQRENYDAPFLQEQFRRALLELPILLAVIAGQLPRTRGNASKLAREMDIPQRQMARYLARIRDHFAKHGLGS